MPILFLFLFFFCRFYLLLCADITTHFFFRHQLAHCILAMSMNVCGQQAKVICKYKKKEREKKRKRKKKKKKDLSYDEIGREKSVFFTVVRFLSFSFD